MILRQQFSLMRLGILSLLMAVFSALALAPINARSTHKALYNDASLTSHLMTPHAGHDTITSARQSSWPLLWGCPIRLKSS